MTTDFNLYLGKKASEGKITQDTFSGGIKKEQIKSKEMLSIFNAIDDGDGILDKKEAEKLKGLIVASAKDDNLSEAEALEFLNKNNIKNATAKDLFNFLNTLTEAGKKIYASNEKTADTNNKAELDANKAKQQEAASIASDFYGACAQMKFRALDGEYFKSVLHRITDENASRVISQYNAQHPEETIVELICNEKTSSSDARKEALTHIINKLADEARSKGVPEADVQKLQDEFMVSMNAEFKKIGIIDPKKMEACLKSLHGLVLGASIEKTDISEEEARESVTGAAQEEYTNAKDQYDTARKEEGWLAKSGDTILGWFGCTTSADMDKKLEAYKTDIQRLQNCKTDAEFNKVYEEVFGIPFDSKKVAAYEAAKADYMTAYGAKAGVEKFDELATKADGLDYEAYRATVAEAIPQFSEEELDQIVNSLYEQLKESNPDVDKKTALKYYVDLCKQQQQALYDEVSQGRSLEQMSSEVDAVLQGAFGTRDIVNDVIKYNQNQQLTEMAAEMTAEIAATAVLQVIPGVGQLAAAKLAVSASKWAGKGIKIAKYAKKAESALNKVNTAMNANKAAKVASNAGAAFTGTTAVDFSNGKSVKDALKKGLQNAAFAGGGAFATEFAAVLSKTYGLTNEVAKKLAEEITERTLDVMASAGISAALIGEYASTDAFMDIAVGVIMGQLGKKGLKNPAKTGSPEAAGKPSDAGTQKQKESSTQTSASVRQYNPEDIVIPDKTLYYKAPGKNSSIAVDYSYDEKTGRYKIIKNKYTPEQVQSNIEALKAENIDGKSNLIYMAEDIDVGKYGINTIDDLKTSSLLTKEEQELVENLYKKFEDSGNKEFIDENIDVLVGIASASDIINGKLVSKYENLDAGQIEALKNIVEQRNNGELSGEWLSAIAARIQDPVPYEVFKYIDNPEAFPDVLYRENGFAPITREEGLQMIEQVKFMEEFLESQSVPKDIKVQRIDDYSVLSGIKVGDKTLAEVLEEAVQNGNVDDVLKMLNNAEGLGVTYTNFIVTSMSNAKIFSNKSPVKWEIEVPEGTKGAFISAAVPGYNNYTEAEFLLQRNSSLKFKGVEYKDGAWHIKAEVVQGGEPVKSEIAPLENEVSTPAKEEVPKAAEPPKNETVEESVTVDKAENSAGDEVEVLAVESGSVYGSKLSAREVQDIESLISDRMTKAKTAEQINEINALLAALPDSPNKTKFREDFDNLVKTLDPAEVQKAAKMHEANFERLKAANRSLDVNGINSLLSQIERRPEIAEQLMDIATNGKRYDFEMPEIIKIANKNNIDDLVKICQNPSLRLHYNSDGKVVGNDFSTVLKIANSFPDIKSQVLDVASRSNRPQHEIYAIADMMEAYPDSVDDIARLTISNANIKVGYDINNNPQYDVYKIISLAYRNQEYEKDILDYMAVQRRANNDTTDVCELMDFHLDTLKKFPEQRDVIAALSKDPNLDAVSIRYLVQSYRHDPAKLQDIIKLSAKKYDENTINRMMNSFEKNPNLRNIYLSDSPEFTLIDKNPDAAPVEVIEKRFAVRDKVEKSAPDELKKLQTTLGDEYFAKVKWEDIIPENASPEEVKEILSNLNEVSKFFARTSVNERNYGKNIQWAHQMNQISEAAAERIRSNASFDDVIQNIAQDYRSFDVSTTLDSNVEVSDRRKFSGVYRGYNNDGGATTPFDQNGSYSEYYDRFDKMLDDADFKGIKRPKPYEDVELTNFIYCQRGKCMYHPRSATVEPAMNHMRERYNELAPLFEKVKNGGTLTDAEKAMANDKIAEIYYLMANVMPWARGSNGISDIFMRSMYKSLGIDQPALKQGVSLDLEAFCVPLEEYKANWKTFFEQAA